jgi:hypothetical protein
MGWLFASHENSTIPMQELHTQVCKNDQTIPGGAILLGVLKAIEKELGRRGLLRPAVDQAMPLWFLAETERNVFLWRHGRSIDDCRAYNFWVDIPALIEKRRNHLSRCRGFNPFVCGSPSETGAQHELRYLDQIEDMADSIFLKAALVSRASESLQQELDPSQALCTSIVLPYRTDTALLPG